MKENEDLLGDNLDSLKMSKILNEDNKNIIEEDSSNNIFNFLNKKSVKEEKENFIDEEAAQPFDSIEQIDKKNNKKKRKILIYNIKDHLMMIFLLLSSTMNFSILYLPLIVIGILYILLLLNHNNDIKRIKLKIEIGCLIYSILLIITKLALIGMIDNGNLDSEKKLTTLNNLGLRYNKEEESIFDLISTFVGEGFLLIVCIYSIFISILYKNLSLENEKVEITKGNLFFKIKFLIYVCYILFFLFGSYNTSYITYLYILIYHILLIIITFKNNFPAVFYTFKNIRLTILSILPIQLILINIFNIYSLQEEFLNENKIPKEAKDSDIKKVYSFLTKIGINCSFYPSLFQYMYSCISYVICVTIIVLMTSCKKIINDYKNLVNPKKLKDLYELKNITNEGESSPEKNSKEEENNNSFLHNTYLFLFHFLTHCDFIIHLIRGLSIIWIYYFRNFFSIGIFINLFFSFIINDMGTIRIIVIFLLIPVATVSLGFLHISNINGYFEDLKEKDKKKYMLFGFEKDEDNYKYILIGSFYLCIILFLNSFTNYNPSIKVKINLSHNKILLTDSEIENTEEFNEKKIPLINENGNENKLNKNVAIKNNEKEVIRFLDVFLKFIYQNIDKIILVGMYFVSMHTINIIHFIFIVIFMLQILQAKIIQGYNKIIIIIIQILFLFEYFIGLIQNYKPIFEDHKDLYIFLLSLSEEDEGHVNVNIEIEIYCYIAIYAFHIQNLLMNSTKYQELEKNKNITLNNYINYKFETHKTIKYIFFRIFNIINEIFIWFLFFLFFCVCNFEINILFSIKLGIFFYVVYNFLQKIQIIEKDINISLKSNSFLIIYCCLNSFIVYGYQLLCLDFFGIYSSIQNSKNIFVQNFPSLGLINYHNKNLLRKLLPHFLSNFLSILLYYELKTIYDRIDKKKKETNINNDISFKNQNPTTNNITLNDIITNKEKIDENDDAKLKEDDIYIIKNNENKIINNEEILEINTNKEINKKEEEEEEEDSEKEEKEKKSNKLNIKDNINIEEEKNKYSMIYYELESKRSSLNKKYIFYRIIIFILNLYHPFFFLFICFIFTSYSLSFSMIIYFLVFGLNFIFMFVNILKCTCNYNYNYYHPFIFSQLIRYKFIEAKKHKIISNKYKYKTFKYLSIFNFIFLFLNYFYSIIYYLKDCNNNLGDNDDENLCFQLLINNINHGKDFEKIAYIFGVYNYIDMKELLTSSGLQFLFCFLIFMDVYIQKIKIKFDFKKKNNRDIYYIINKKKNNIKSILFSIKLIEQKKDGNNNNENYKILNELINNYKKIQKNRYTKFIIDKKNFKNDFINIFIKSKNNKFLLPKNSTKRSIVIFLILAKKIYEYLIIFVLICGVIIKINIWSIIYMLAVIYLLLTKKNINRINFLFKIIIISTFFQSVIILSNINKNNDPKEKIQELSYEPWFNYTLGNNTIKHSLILGLGINRSQVLLIWVEYIIIFLIYIYLYYFCFTIFNNRFIELKEWKKQKNSLIYNLLYDIEFREALLKMKKSNQYEKLSKCVKSNFELDIASFSEVLNAIDKLNNNENSSEKKESQFKINIFDYIFYLFWHNIILITIAIISMMIYGFFSVIYIFFCLYFLYKSKSINKGKIYYYPFIIKSLLRPIIIFDISCQLIIQIAYIYLEGLFDDGFFKYLSNGLGLIKITNEEYELTNDILLLLGKCFCLFCMCIQKVIYSSRSFNQFYLSYLIVKDDKSNIISLINTFRFNNERISVMNKSMKLKKDMEDLMKNLQEDLKEWNKKLFSNENNNNININSINKNSENNIEIINTNSNNNNNEENINKNDNDNNNVINLLNSENNNNNNRIISIDNFLNIPINENKIADKEIVVEVVKNWIINQTFLLKLHLFLNKKAFCYRMIEKRKEENHYIINTIQGKNYYVPIIERKIDDLILKLDLTSFKNNEIGTLKKFLKRLNKINSYNFGKLINFLNGNNEKEIEKNLDEKLKILMKQQKYIQFPKIKNSKLFKKYLAKTYLLRKIIIDIQSIISNNFNWVCYFGMILNHIINSSIISLFYPISIFCYALLEYPRPSKKYWNICFIYTFIFLIIKFIMQKEFIGAFLNISKNDEENDKETIYKSLQTFFNHYPIGIKLFDDNNIKNYFFYLITDFLVIILLIINMHILIVNGLWENNEKIMENIYEAMNRLSINKDKIFENEKDINSFNKEYLSDKINTNKYIQRKSTMLKNDQKDYNNMMRLKDKYIEQTKSYYEQLFPKIRNEKPGRDYYSTYALTMIILIFYILFYYTTMVKDKTYGAVDISTNQFSGMTIMLVLLHMLILIFDRVIYLRQNKYIIKYDYNFYDKKKGKLITENSSEYEKIKENIIKLYPKCNKNDDFKIPLEYITELNKNYNLIIFQNETFNIPLLEKYILHMILVIFSHLFIFFFITMTGNYNIHNAVYCIREQDTDECNDFLENKTIVFFYLIFLVYHIFSALQIKYGYYDLKRKSIFKNINSLQGLLFEIYKLIPFYYQIKNVVDWTFTPTSLNLFDWFKFENIYDETFKTYRIKYPIEKRPIGKRIKNIFKLLIGGFTSFILILILVLPLILFSGLNPTNQINNVTSAQIKIYLSFLYNNQEKNYLIFDNYWSESIKEMTKTTWNKFKYYNSLYTKTFPQKQIQIISFYSEPENTISLFKLSHILASIKSLLNSTNSTNESQEKIKTCHLIIDAEFARPLPAEAKIVTKQIKLLICDYLEDKNSQGCIGLNQTFNFLNDLDNIIDLDELNITIKGFSPFVRLTSNSEPKNIELDIDVEKNLTLKPSYRNNSFFFELYFDSNLKSETGLQFHVFNDKASSSTSGYSIIGFYSAFILVIGTYVTSFFNYEPEKIIIGEMPHPEKLLNLCECVKISRYTHDFKKEEYLYNILIEIMRTPDFIKKLTQSTVEQFQRRTSLPS